LKSILLPAVFDSLLQLDAGEEVLLSGTVVTARDAAHARLEKLLASGSQIPFPLSTSLVYYMSPTDPACGRVIGSAGPTTSARMDRWMPMLMSRGLRATMGKGPRSREVTDLHASFGAVYLAAVGGAGALASTCIRKAETLAWQDLGPERMLLLELDEFPAFVAIDSRGRTIFSRGGDWNGLPREGV
jgi:fumarate hydratase subunit beta